MSAAAAKPLTMQSLTGAQKCAILCMTLGPENAASLLQRLSPDQVEEVTREIATLPAVDPELARQVVDEARNAATASAGQPRGGIDFAQRVLQQALGDAKATTVIDRVQEQVTLPAMHQLRKLPTDMLRALLLGEHPQTAAVVLAHLDPRPAADLAAALGAERATEVLARMARTEKLPADVVTLIDDVLARGADPTLVRPAASAGGAGAVARLINHAAATGSQMLQSLQEKNPELAERVQNLMFVFEDLTLVDNKGMQRLMREIDTKDLALALKGASPDLRQHFRSAMSERAASALDEEMEILGSVRVKDVEAAHSRIIDHVRALESANEITIRGRGGNDDVVA